MSGAEAATTRHTRQTGGMRAFAETERVYTLVAGGLAAVGLVGACVQASFLYTPTLSGPPPALGVYLAALVSFFGFEALFLSQAGAQPIATSRAASRCRRGGTLLANAACALLFVGFLVGFRLDGALWTLALGAALSLVSLRVLAVPRTQGRGGGRGCTVVTTEVEAQAQAEEEAEGLSPYSPLAGDKTQQIVSTGDDTALPPLVVRPAPAVQSDSAPGASPTTAAVWTCVPPSGGGVSRTVQALTVLHSCVWLGATTALLLLLGGCGTIAVGWHLYPARGQFYDLTLASGAVQRIHAWCTGPVNASLPTVWLEVGGGGHSMSDGYGLQFALNARGRRVCTHDPPGTAWSKLSPSLSPAALPNVELTSLLIAAMGEPGPFILVGTADGAAERIYAYALAQPAHVAALVPMQHGVGEFKALAAYYGWSPAVAAAHASSVLSTRVALADVIRFLAVPWGLMPAFAPTSPTFVPQELQRECHFLNLMHEGQWDMQARYLAAQVASPGSTVLAVDAWEANRSLAAHIPVLAVDNVPADPCGNYKYPPGSDDCAALLYTFQAGSAFMREMTSMTAGSVYTSCEGGPRVCNDWLGFGATVPYVVDTILRHVGNITVRR